MAEQEGWENICVYYESLLQRIYSFSTSTYCTPTFLNVVVQSQVVSDSLDSMDCSTPGFPVIHYLLEFAQTHVHWVSDAIQLSHPFSSCLQSFPASGSFPIVKGVPMGKSSILELQARSHNRNFLSPTPMPSTMSFTSHPGFSYRLNLNLSVQNGIIHVCICVHACSGMSNSVWSYGL